MLVLVTGGGSIAEGWSITDRSTTGEEHSKSMVWKFGGFSYEDGAAIKGEDSNLEFSIFWLFYNFQKSKCKMYMKK